jgi:3-mercaptopyruvate sulfurtransferase SseA
MLKERGVKSVRALTGGWNTWVESKGAIVKGKQP